NRLAIINVESGEVKWVDHGQKLAPSPDDAKESAKDGAKEGGKLPEKQAEKDRDVQIFQPVWSEDGTKAVMLARAADNKDRWILALDENTAKTRVVVHDHDDAWIDGPGSFTLGWLKNDREIYFQSERTGYSHLYAVSFEGGEPKALTSGKWEVDGV